MSLLPLFPLLFAVKWWDQIPWSQVFLMLSSKLGFSFSTCTLIKRLFCSSSLSAIRVASSVYVKLLTFLPAILIPACDSSSPAFHMMYSAYRFFKNKVLCIWVNCFSIYISLTTGSHCGAAITQRYRLSLCLSYYSRQRWHICFFPYHPHCTIPISSFHHST